MQPFSEISIVGSQPSKFRQTSVEEKEDIAQTIIKSGAAITLVGLGCPRQEVWVYEYRHLLAMPTLAVGAAFDFHAGTLAQAPTFLQRHGLEWFFRLLHEPKRLWKRYMLLNPYYTYLVLLQSLGLRTFKTDNLIPPHDELRYG